MIERHKWILRYAYKGSRNVWEHVFYCNQELHEWLDCFRPFIRWHTIGGLK